MQEGKFLFEFTDDDILSSNRKGFIFEKCVVGYNGEDGHVYVSDTTKYTLMAFRSNEAIKHVVWDAEYIPPTCFLECKNLESIELSGKVKAIGEWAFRDCVSLKEILIPNSVQVIHPTAFSHSGITNIIMDNELYSYENGFLVDSVLHGLRWVNKNIVGNNIIVPNGIEEIGDEAFDSYDYNDRLQIIISDSVKKICSTEYALLHANIRCKKDSHAHKYAEAYGCKYEII